MESASESEAGFAPKNTTDGTPKEPPVVDLSKYQ